MMLKIITIAVMVATIIINTNSNAIITVIAIAVFFLCFP